MLCCTCMLNYKVLIHRTLVNWVEFLNLISLCLRTLCLHGNNAAVTDIECLNCWNAVRAVGAGRHYIARIQGQPINTVSMIS